MLVKNFWRSVILLIFINRTPLHSLSIICFNPFFATLEHLPILRLWPQFYLLILYPQILVSLYIFYLDTEPIVFQFPLFYVCLWHEHQSFISFFSLCNKRCLQLIVYDLTTAVIRILKYFFHCCCNNIYLCFIQLFQFGIMLIFIHSDRFLFLSLIKLFILFVSIQILRNWEKHPPLIETVIIFFVA